MKSVKIISSALFLTVFVAGCSGYRPIVDGQGRDMSNYEYDLRDCQNYARQVDGAGRTGGGALAGAAFGAVLGLVGGGNSSNIAQAAGVGAVTGGAAGGVSTAASQKQIIRNCMVGRGYRVLD
ncbi:MAG: glycine zipper family protein [Advenella sp.]|nr:glycine zipper family protein [Advenella sp.]